MTPGDALAAAAERAAPVRVSFEFFPPKTEKLEEQLWAAIAKLEPLSPTFVSVTYGAGGSTRDRTHRTVARLIAETRLAPAAHLTTVAASRADVDEVLHSYWDAGVRHLVALRGDPPGGLDEAYVPHPDGYRNATELVAAARRAAPFEISVGVYPERHPESPSIEHDIEVLKAKIDAGASRGISQFFFEAETFLRFRDRAAAAGITSPICPGIMPVTNFKGIIKMAAGCGAAVPNWLARMFDGLDDDPETRRLVAAAVSAQLCARLAAEGVEDFHFYTLNRADLTIAICRILGRRAQQDQPA
jgi:methylenetetrahydrofolate reductase (NADPH)